MSELHIQRWSSVHCVRWTSNLDSSLDLRTHMKEDDVDEDRGRRTMYM